MSKIFAFATVLLFAPLTAVANGHGGWHGGSSHAGHAWGGGYAPHAIWHGGAHWGGRGFYGARVVIGPAFYGYYAPPVYYAPYYAPVPVYYPSYAPVVVEQRVYQQRLRPAPQRVTPYDSAPPPGTPAPQSQSSSQREGGTMSAPAKADRN